MKPFTYARPADEGAARAAGAADGARYLAGGTGLVDLWRLGVENPASLVDIKGLGLDQIEATPDGGLRIGALARNSDVAYHARVREAFPALSQALLAGASPQIRNMATTGGNLLQRTRCSYFRDPTQPCHKREPGTGCGALTGYHRMHAILGGSEQCIAVNPSDMNVALVALEARVIVRGPKGERTVAMSDLHVVPGTTPQVETVLERGELITHVTLAPSPVAARSVYVKVRDRASYAFALASAAVGLELDGDTIKTARVALGGVATKPWRCPEAERALVGKKATPEVFRKAAQVATTGARPLRDNAFKVPLVQRVVARALEQAAGGSR